MRPGLLTAFLIAASLPAGPALAGDAPQSNAASNIGPADTSSAIAPRLPTPPAGDDATIRQYLLDARQALAEGRTGTAQEALERAETRMLDRAVPAPRLHQPNRSPLVEQVAAARQALGTNDTNRALQISGRRPLDPAERPARPSLYRGAAAPAGADPPPPGARYVWLPGHWLWNGRAYVWVRGRYGWPRRRNGISSPAIGSRAARPGSGCLRIGHSGSPVCLWGP